MTYSHYSERQNPTEDKSKLPFVLSKVGAVIILILVIAFIWIAASGSVKQKQINSNSYSLEVLNNLATIPQSVFNQVGVGNSNSVQPPTKINSTALTSAGKPEVLYMGDEWCPYCGAERWVLAVTLARFGTISDINLGYSSSTDIYPNTPTLSFAKVKFSSPYISFNAVEMQTLNHTPLENPTPEESNLLSQIGQNNIPFIDINGKWYSATSYSPQALQGLTQQTIASDLHNPRNTVALIIIAASNYMSAAVCSVDGDMPSTVCNSQGVIAAKNALGIS